MTDRSLSFALCALCISWLIPGPRARADESKFVHPGPDGKLVYVPDEKGNTIPDFSNCGYMGGGVKLPIVTVKLTLAPDPSTTDDTPRIQKAIDQVSALPLDDNHLRGAVLLKKGRYRIASQLKIKATGVVLRGEGQSDADTVLVGTGKTTRFLIQIGGGAPKEIAASQSRITDPYVPVGAHSFTVEDPTKFKPGDTVFVNRIGNANWIHEIAMDRIVPRDSNPTSTRQWQPFTLAFDRVVIAIDGHRVTVDAPIACAIEQQWGGGSITKYTDEDRVQNSGVENLRSDSEFDKSITLKRGDKPYPADEKHAQGLVSFDSAKNCWARDLTAIHFYHGVANVGGRAKWITIQDSAALDPVSEITGARRYPFALNGQLTLVQRCHSKAGRHAFVFGARVPGPNVFLDCASEEDYATSEPHHRWSVGGLYDNVNAHMAVQDRGYMGSGHGWAGANYVIWNCEGTLVLQKPPTANNWAIGFVGKKEPGAFERPDGNWESLGKHVEPKSLYLKQLEDRLGKSAVANVTAK